MNQKKQITTDNGFIQLHRKMLDWEWYTDINTCKLFIHLLLRANYKDNKFKGTLVKKGSHLTSYNILANETGLSVKKVRTALEKLIKTGEVAKLSTPLGTSVSVINYDLYQNDWQATGKASAKQGQSIGKPSATNNKDNKDNKDNILSWWNKLAYDTNLPMLKKVSDSRMKSINVRCEEYKIDIDTFKKELSSLISNSDFLQNKGSWSGVNIDWILKPNNFLKIYEGNYNNKNVSSKSTMTKEEEEAWKNL